MVCVLVISSSVCNTQKSFINISIQCPGRDHNILNDMLIERFECLELFFHIDTGFFLKINVILTVNLDA